MREYERRTLEALIDGPPGLPGSLGLGDASTVARWVGESHGAVLVLRLRGDGDWDGTTMHFTFERDRWDVDVQAGGSWPDPTDRPAMGWDGKHIDFIRVSGTNDVRVIQGQVSGGVARLVLESPSGREELELDAMTGAFLVGSERAVSVSLAACDGTGEKIDEEVVTIVEG